MNTRFKFRVWDKRKKRYDDRYVIGSDGWAYQLVDVCDDWYDLNSNEEVIVEQCTGLKDNNGKLIFEGDVVRQSYEDGGKIDRIVYYNDLQCRWFLRLDFPNIGADESAFWNFNSLVSDELEIIGNIHEEQSRNKQPEFTEDCFCECCSRRISSGRYCSNCEDNQDW